MVMHCVTHMSVYAFFECLAFVTYFESSFFFFQAEDGIRDLTVTGVQTCALPISSSSEDSGQVQVKSNGASDNATYSLGRLCLKRFQGKLIWSVPEPGFQHGT